MAKFSDYEGIEHSCLREGNRLALYFAHPAETRKRGNSVSDVSDRSL
jgi:hypothetical protein